MDEKPDRNQSTQRPKDRDKSPKDRNSKKKQLIGSATACDKMSLTSAKTEPKSDFNKSLFILGSLSV
jgi:hypothetical protein